MAKTKTPLIDRLDLPTLDKLHTRQITGAEVAAQLGVSGTHLSRVLSAEGFKKLPGPVLQKRKAITELVKTRHEYRQGLADKVAAKTITIEQACAKAKCSERTMWRYIAKGKALAEGL